MSKTTKAGYDGKFKELEPIILRMHKKGMRGRPMREKLLKDGHDVSAAMIAYILSRHGLKPHRPELSEQDKAAIYKRVKAVRAARAAGKRGGDTLAAIGKDYDVSGEWVRQVAASHEMKLELRRQKRAGE